MSMPARFLPVVAAALLLGLAAVALTAYRLGIVGRGDSLGNLLTIFAMVFASAGLISAAKRTSGDARRSWLWLAAGAVVYLIGEIAFALQSTAGGEPPGISVADVFWLGALPLWFAGLQIRAPEGEGMWHSARGEGLLDGLIIVGFFGILIGNFVPRELFAQGVPLDQVLVGLAYPAVDLALIWLLLRGIYRTDRSWGADQGLLALGLLFLVVGDILWAGGAVDSAAFPDLAYAGAGLALGGAGFVASNSIQRGGDAEAIATPPRPLVIDLMPYVAGIGALVMAFWVDLSGEGDVAISLAAICVLLMVYLRLALTVRQNRRLRHAAEEQALLDPLTGLKNHRHFQERLGEEIAAARRSETSVGLLMIDIDRFKDVNDTIGHLGGDRLLDELGEVLRENSRPYDSPCRIGGDEFAVILPGAEPESLDAVAHRILAAASEIRLAASDNDTWGDIQVSVSIGGCLFPEAAADERDLISNADLALYQSKRDGRGRITVFDPGVAGPVGPGEALAAAERELRERERDVTHVFAAAADPLLVLSQDGEILDANPAACRLSGLPVDQMRERSILDFLKEDDVERVVRVVAGDEPGLDDPADIEIVLPDGTSRWVEFHAAEFPPDRFLLNLRDITDQRATLLELALSEEKFRALFESAGDAIYVVDDDGVIREVNNSGVELSGTTREQLIGSKVDAMLDEEKQMEVSDLTESLLTGRGDIRGVFEGTWADGSRRALQFSAVANFVPGRHLSIVRDVTELVDARRAGVRDPAGTES